jgi:TRAP-type C4-dicarboxylate transport system permease small subunit
VTLARLVAAVVAAATVLGAAGATALTVFAYRYSTRTGEDFAYLYAVLAWTGVLLGVAVAAASWRAPTRRRRAQASGDRTE